MITKLTLPRYLILVGLALALMAALIAGPVTQSRMGPNGSPVTILGQEPDRAHAAYGILVSALSQRGVYFTYYGNTIIYYLPPGAGRSTIQSWIGPNGTKVGWHCSGRTGKYTTSGGIWMYPTCDVFIDVVYTA